MDPDQEARATLRRHQRLATGLLLLMAAVTIGCYWLPPGYWSRLLQASAKAGVVGGLADWFAVTALFRRPLGLPIPHTAIIPAEKARLGQALGRFVARHVINEAEIRPLLARFEVARFAAGLLTEPHTAEPLARALAGYLPRLLATLEDGRARRTLGRLMPRIIGGPGAGRVVARALRSLVEGGRHQDVIGFILDKLREGMAAKEEQLRGLIEDRVREQGGRLVGWAVGASIATRVLAAVNLEMERMGPDGSDVRAAIDEWLKREIDRVETDPERAAELGRAVRRIVGNETMQAWLWDVWARLRMALEADAARPNGHTMALLTGAIGNLGTMLAQDKGARERLQRGSERALISLLPAMQAEISGFIGNVVGSWDSATIVDRLELRVGKDLQYVRINGTLVGFLVGGAAYAALIAIFGRAAF